MFKMNKIFDKSKIYNYLVAGIFLITAIMFIKNMASFIWNFDMFNRRQLFTFIKYIANGKAFSSGKQVSFLITFIGALCVTVSGVLVAMQLKFFEEPKNDVGNDVGIDVKEENNAENTTKENEKVEAKEPEKVEVVENIPTMVNEIPSPETKYEMYNNTPKQEIKPEIIEEPVNISEEISKNEEEERAKLQAKIREIMKKMKEKQENPEELAKEEKNEEKLLSKVDFSNKSQKIDMNFKNISEQDNTKVEQTIISAGFKLLSEIRIGSTGIDYLGVAKDKLVVVQLDTTEGNWFASEDKVEGNQTPVWFSEMGNKISPVSRALEAKDNLTTLLNGEIDLPIETIACLTNSNVVNYSEYAENWENIGVKVVNLYENEEDSLSDVKALSELYPIQSQEEIAEESMNKIISILEKAEIPE